ncbi:MAG TPA: amidase [Hyphomicrobiaceae bacterium]|nr:amidase [Hyphomicrobiaceae bacterium]
MTELQFKTAIELAEQVRTKQISALELTDLFIDRIENLDGEINAVVVRDFDRARDAARAADAALANGKIIGPLHGVPMTIKESYQFAGSPTTWGVPALRDNITTTNALTVDRLERAGVTLFGKTNVPIYLADWQSFNAIYGTTNNPWDLGRTPGGSSGGSAAALAAGLTGFDAGSDIGASIRDPAHYCGVFGHKPTYGIVPPRGQSMPGAFAAADISVIGPMARGARDLDVGLDVMAGPDLLDDAGWRLELPKPRQTSLKDFRIAVKLSDPNSEVDEAYTAKLQELVERLSKAGAKVSDTAHPDVDTRRLHEIYVLLLRAATSGRTPDAEIAEWRVIAEGLSPDDTTYKGRMARGNIMSHREWLHLNNERHALRFKFAEFFRDWDILLCPAAASAAWPHDQAGERHNRTIPVNGKQVPTTDQLFWAGFSGVVFLPSTVGPAGITRDGLPVGYQAIAGHMQDKTAIRFSELVAKELVGFTPPPGYD